MAGDQREVVGFMHDLSLDERMFRAATLGLDVFLHLVPERFASEIDLPLQRFPRVVRGTPAIGDEPPVSFVSRRSIRFSELFQSPADCQPWWWHEQPSR